MLPVGNLFWGMLAGLNRPTSFIAGALPSQVTALPKTVLLLPQSEKSAVAKVGVVLHISD